MRLKGGGRIGLTIYEPENIGKNAPCLVYYHGGAFVLRDRPSTHRLAQVYTREVRCKVVIVHYRLGKPYPEPVKDCYRGADLGGAQCGCPGVDRERIAVIGMTVREARGGGCNFDCQGQEGAVHLFPDAD